MAEESLTASWDDQLTDHGIYFFGEDINYETCSRAIKFILAKNLQDPPLEAITLVIMSSGGELPAALGLIDVMNGSAIPVRTVALGEVASSALFVFMAGAQGHRIITENTSIMSHQFSWAVDGKMSELIAAGHEIELTQKRLLKHIKRHTGLTPKNIQKYLLPSADIYMDAETAIRLQIADRVIKNFSIQDIL